MSCRLLRWRVMGRFIYRTTNQPGIQTLQTVYDIFEAVGVGAAAGLSPLVAIAAIVILIAANLGVNAANTDVSFIEGVAFVAIAAVVLVQSFVAIFTPGGVKVRVAADRPRVIWIHTLLAMAVGALGGAVVFNAEGHSLILGALIAVGPAAVVAIAASTLLSGVVRRLDERAARAAAKGAGNGDVDAKAEAITSQRILAFAVDLLTIVAALLALVTPPLALILPLLSTALIIGSRRREAKKHEGLRVLR